MESQAKAGQARRSREKLGLYLALGALGAMIVAAILVNHVATNSAVRKKLAGLEAAGQPISLEEVDRRYHAHGRDPRENAAPLYEKMFSQMDTWRDDFSWTALRDALPSGSGFQRLDAETLQALGEAVAENQEAVRLCKEAAAGEYLHFDLDFTEGNFLVLPHVGDLRTAARLLSVEAIVAAEAGEAERAGDALEAIFRMAGHMADEPTLISQLTRIAIEGIGRTALERVIDRAAMSPATLGAIRASLQALEETDSPLAAAMGTELAFGWSVYREMDEADGYGLVESGSERLDKVLFFLYQASGMLARDQHHYLLEMEEILRVAALPLVERAPLAEHLHADAEDRKDAPGALWRGRLISSWVTPSLAGVILSDVRGLTYLRAATIALAAEQYRLEQGHFPEKLEDLAPAYLSQLPPDPYAAGKNFSFVREGDAVFIRSEGTYRVKTESRDRQIQFRLPLRRARDGQ